MDVEGKIIGEFPSPEVAMRELKIKSKLIAMSIAGTRPVVLGKWKFAFKAAIPAVAAPAIPTQPGVEELVAPKIIDSIPADPEDKWLTPYERILRGRRR